FFELAGPFVALAAAAVLPDRDPARPRPFAAVLIAGLLAQAAWSKAGLPTPYGSRAFAGAAEALRREVRPGALVFQDDWRSWAQLFFHDPIHRYAVGCDPTLTRAFDRRTFELWRRLALEGPAGPADA